MTIFTKVGADIASPVDAAGAPRSPSLADFQVWMTEMELAAVARAVGAVTFGTKAEADAALTYAAWTTAWIIADATVANNGWYTKSGASGTGSWVRKGDLPYSYIKATNVGAGTANAIVATTATPIPAADGGALIALPIAADTTASPVTVAFNGGTALTIKSNSGNDIAAGGLTAGMIVAGYVAGGGTTFRLLSDQDAAALLAEMEAALADFRSKYLGSHADNAAATAAADGSPSEGQLYWNTTDNEMRVWDGSAWLPFASETVVINYNRGRNGIYNLYDLGARPDNGGTENSTYIEEAFSEIATNDGGRGRIIIPPTKTGEQYHFSRPIVMQSGVIIDARGAELYKNSGGGLPLNAVLLPGGWGPTEINMAGPTWLAANDISAGDLAVVTTAAADAGAFAPGDLIFVRGGPVYLAASQDRYTYWKMSEVISVNETTGDVVLAEPIDESWTGIEITKANDTGLFMQLESGGDSTIPLTAVKNAAIIGGRWYGSVAMTHGGGAYRCLFDVEHVENKSGLLYGNSFAHCRMRAQTQRVWQKAIEIAIGSHDSLFECGHIAYWNIAGSSTDRPLVSLTESSRRNRIWCGTINAGDGWDWTDSGVVSIHTVRRNFWRIDNLVAPHAQGPLVDFLSLNSSGAYDAITDYNDVSVGYAVAGSATSYVRWDATTGSDKNVGNRLLDGEFSGAVTTGALEIVGSPTGVYTGKNCRFQKGKVVVASGENPEGEINGYFAEEPYTQSSERGRLRFKSIDTAYARRGREVDSVIFSNSVTSSASSYVLTKTLPANAFGTNQVLSYIEMELDVEITGTSNFKTVTITIGGTNVCVMTAAAATTGGGRIRGRFYSGTNTNVLYNFEKVGIDAGVVAGTVTGLSALTSNTLEIKITASIANDADRVHIRSGSIRFRVAGEG